MYAVVGCSECAALWVVEGRPETSECPRCGHRRKHAKRRKFVSTEDEGHARQVRAALLAERSDHGDAFSELDSYAEMEAAIDEAGVDDGEYLEGSGVDPEAVAEAGERASEGRGAAGGTSAPEVVRAALSDLERPTREDVVGYAAERGVDRERAGDLLERLRRRGDVIERDGRYRRI